MKIIKPSVHIMSPPEYKDMLKHIEAAGRTCYQSTPKGEPDKFIKMIIDNGHGSVLEHTGLSVRFICDRGVSHELVRHRLCSFSQESTRYCRYDADKFGNEVTFIEPLFWEEGSSRENIWLLAMHHAEAYYLELLNQGASPQEARSVLPNSTKTEIVVTANLREWRLIFSQRCDKAAHPEMRRVMLPLLEWCITDYQVFFEDMKDLFLSGEADFRTKGWELAEVEVDQC